MLLDEIAELTPDTDGDVSGSVSKNKGSEETVTAR